MATPIPTSKARPSVPPDNRIMAPAKSISPSFCSQLKDSHAAPSASKSPAKPSNAKSFQGIAAVAVNVSRNINQTRCAVQQVVLILGCVVFLGLGEFFFP